MTTLSLRRRIQRAYMHETKSDSPYGAQSWFARQVGVKRRTVHRWCSWSPQEHTGQNVEQRGWTNSNPARSFEGRYALAMLRKIEQEMDTGQRIALARRTREVVRAES